MTPVDISRIHFPVTTLGPGNRVGIWFQGCSIRCPGCISADTWAVGKGRTTVDDVVVALREWLPIAEGITVSGGEPFDQPVALVNLLQEIRARSACDILVFSGHPREAIDSHLADMPGLIDALISDPFLIGAAQTLALRGSDNQRLSFLTPLGAKRFAAYERSATRADQKFDLMQDDDGQIWMAGIPHRDDFVRLSNILSAHHHRVRTTQDQSVRPWTNSAND